MTFGSGGLPFDYKSCSNNHRNNTLCGRHFVCKEAAIRGILNFEGGEYGIGRTKAEAAKEYTEDKAIVAAKDHWSCPSCSKPDEDGDAEHVAWLSTNLYNFLPKVDASLIPAFEFMTCGYCRRKVSYYVDNTWRDLSQGGRVPQLVGLVQCYRCAIAASPDGNPGLPCEMQ